LVSLSAVVDPFGNFVPEVLAKCLKDVLIPIKEHFVADLTRPILSLVKSHNQRKIRKALKTLVVKKCGEPLAYLDEWIDLYAHLV